MDDYEILMLLQEKADNKILAEFAKCVFLYELNGLGMWGKEYDILLHKFVDEVDE